MIEGKKERKKYLYIVTGVDGAVPNGVQVGKILRDTKKSTDYTYELGGIVDGQFQTTGAISVRRIGEYSDELFAALTARGDAAVAQG